MFFVGWKQETIVDREGSREISKISLSDTNSIMGSITNEKHSVDSGGNNAVRDDRKQTATKVNLQGRPHLFKQQNKIKAKEV